MANKLIDLTGREFGFVKVESYAGNSRWNCRCNRCGKEWTVNGEHLRNGRIKSCGCLRMERKPIDLTGREFGFLTVESYAGNLRWNCRCNRCGKECVVNGHELRGGMTKSCGCLRKGRKLNDRKPNNQKPNNQKPNNQKPRNQKPRNLTDLTGQRFGRLTVVSYAGQSKWNCICDCGKECVVRGSSLQSGNTKSCGCLRRETASGVEKHGLSRGKIYNIYYTMINNCYNPKVGGYKKHGQRGIGVCDEWRGDDGFVNFVNWGMANGYVERADHGGCRLERIDASKDYSPENCRWVVRRESAD